MRGLVGCLVLTMCLGLIACGDTSTVDGGPGADGSPAAASQAGSQTDRVATTQDKQNELARRLLALDFFSEQMWPEHENEAGLNWLKTAAGEHDLEIDRVMPELLIERDGVAVRPVTVRAVGEWNDLVGWLQAIEASPRRLILREAKLTTLRNRVVADVKLAVMIDRSTGLSRLAELDVADLQGEELDDAVALIEAELEGKSKAFNQLGADASWSRPVADLTGLMPGDARPMTLTVGRYANGERAQRYTGSFTLLFSDAGQVPQYVRELQRQDGFAAAGLRSIRGAGADWQRATVTFTFAGDSTGQADAAEISDLAGATP